MKKLIIVEHRAHGLANCLLNDLSIYAYGIEAGARVINRTYLEHVWLTRPLHALYARIVDRLTRKTCGIWTTGTPKFLPPTAPIPEIQQAYETLYFFGWLFRNPVGLGKYRAELIAAFAPKRRVQKKIERMLAPYTGKTRIGIHLRERPFTGFENGEFLVSRERVQEIVRECLLERGLKKEDAALIEVSEEDRTSLHLLSQCDVVIGTNSAFSNLAAWFGNIPHIVTTNEPIDWPYYRGHTAYFDNRYATFTHGSLRPS